MLNQVMPLLKPALKAGLVTAAVIVLYQLSNLLPVYHYSHWECYSAAMAVLALGAGIMLTDKYHRRKKAGYEPPNPLYCLTVKELQVLQLIAGGKSNKEIAAFNYVELSTVKTHINNIYSKLGVKNRQDAGKIYLQQASLLKSTLSPPLNILN